MHKIPQITICTRKAGLPSAPLSVAARGGRPKGASCCAYSPGERQQRNPLHRRTGGSLCPVRQDPKVVRDGGRESLTHAFAGPDGEVQTRLTVERWERNGKSGYALSVQRGEEQINVPVQPEQFLSAAEFLRHLSLQQAWVEEPERATE